MSDTAEQLESLGIDGLDLDTAEAAQGGYVFIPRAPGGAHLHLLSLTQAKGEKLGKGLRLRVRLVESDIDGTVASEEYDILFSFVNKTKANYSNQNLRQILCSIYGGDPKNVKFTKVNQQLVDTIKSGEKLAQTKTVVYMKNVGRTVDKDGEKVTYYNPVFSKSEVKVA